MINTLKYIILIFISISVVGCKNTDNQFVDSIIATEVNTQEKENEEPTFSYSEIPKSIKIKMINKSMPENEPTSFDQLSYLKLTYYGFDKKYHLGEMIVNKKVAAEVVDIFRELYESKYPIEKMNLIDEYNANDDVSMKDNNSSSFCYRTIANTNVISNHGKGVAIDINPLYNPHINTSTNKVSPETAYEYIDRDRQIKGMIIENDACYNAFIKRGWTWGGSWRNPDYQHFEKNI